MLDVFETVVDFYTQEKLENVKVLIEEKRDDETWEKYAEGKTTKKGFINSQLFLQKEYMITFSKKGYITKKILINTQMPGRAEAVYEHYNTLLMTNKVATDQDSISLLDKPAIRLYFSIEKYDFAVDSLYRAKVQNEVKSIPADFVNQLIAKMEENSKRDLTDSVAIKKQQDDYIALLNQVKQKIATAPKEDTLVNLNRQKAIQDSLLIAKKKSYDDSLAIANKNKSIQDSLARVKKKDQEDAFARAKARRDSLKMITSIHVPMTPIAAKIESETNEEPVLNKDFITALQIQTDISLKENQVLVLEKSKRIEKEKIVEKEKIANLGTKYETNNSLTSLLDNVDKFDKALKHKALQQ